MVQQTAGAGPGERRRWTPIVAAAAGLASLLACVGTVEGERAAGGCPKGEVCSDKTPNGLLFVGETLFDAGGAKMLGPILVGGRFDLGVALPDEGDLPAVRFDTEDDGVLVATPGQVVDELVSAGAQESTRLRAGRTGTTLIRVVDPMTGELMDRVEFSVFELKRIEVVNAHYPDRDYAIAGCENALGVHLIGTDGSDEVRTFDMDLDVQVEGMVRPDPGYWDCFLVDGPTDRASIDLDVLTSGGVHAASMPVKTLAEAGMTECPG